jgi:hypothetical protein
MKQKGFTIPRALLFAAAVTTFGPAALADEGIFGPIHVAANRHQYTGRGCPIQVIYTGTINFAPHSRAEVFNYHWERSDGGKSPMQVIHVNPNQRSTVVRETWRLGGPGKSYDAGVTLYVNSGNTHLSEPSPIVRINCT